MANKDVRDNSKENTKSLDARGLKCPEPVMLMHNALREMHSGDKLSMLATDPTTKRDVRNFCRYLNHELLDSTEKDGVFQYIVRKG